MNNDPSPPVPGDVPRLLPLSTVVGMLRDPAAVHRLQTRPLRLPPPMAAALTANCRDPDFLVAVITCVHPLPTSVLTRLAADPLLGLAVPRALIASGHRLPDASLRALCVTDRYGGPLLRREIARATQHPLPGPLLARLGGDRCALVRAALARSDRPLPPTLVAALAGDVDADVRVGLARSPRPLPDDVVLRLAATPRPRRVQQAVAARVGLPSHRAPWRQTVTDPGASPLQRAVIAAATSSTAILTRLTGDPDPVVRSAVTVNGSGRLTVGLLSVLADDPDPTVRAAVQARLLSGLTAQSTPTDRSVP